MRIRIDLSFRDTPEEMRSIVPPRFSEVSYDLRSLQEGDSAYTTVFVTPDRAREILEWAESMRDGVSVARHARVYEYFERADFQAEHPPEVVEAVSDVEVHRVDVRNARRAYEIVWACDYCNRLRAKQIDDLDVEITPGYDVLQDAHEEWIVSHRIRSALEPLGFEFRSLKRNKEFYQLLVKDECKMADVYPFKSYYEGQGCPGCGCVTYGRAVSIEGGAGLYNLDYPLTTTWRKVPATLLAFPVGASLALSDIGQFIATIIDPPQHKAGQSVPRNIKACGEFTNRHRFYFASADFCKTMLALDARGIQFSPAKLEPSPPV